MAEFEGRVLILVIEDEVSYREALMSGLTSEGFAVELAEDGLEGLRKFEAISPDVVLLDVMLPGMDGNEVCRRMRAISSVPIIMVSALDAELDVVLGLELGATDYVTKPFRLRELVARINSMLRRVAPPLPLPAPKKKPQSIPEVMVAGPVRMDTARRDVSVRGRRVHMSRREYDLLAIMMSPPGTHRPPMVRSRPQ